MIKEENIGISISKTIPVFCEFKTLAALKPNMKPIRNPYETKLKRTHNDNVFVPEMTRLDYSCFYFKPFY